MTRETLLEGGVTECRKRVDRAFDGEVGSDLTQAHRHNGLIAFGSVLGTPLNI